MKSGPIFASANGDLLFRLLLVLAEFVVARRRATVAAAVRGLTVRTFVVGFFASAFGRLRLRAGVGEGLLRHVPLVRVVHVVLLFAPGRAVRVVVVPVVAAMVVAEALSPSSLPARSIAPG